MGLFWAGYKKEMRVEFSFNKEASCCPDAELCWGGRTFNTISSFHQRVCLSLYHHICCSVRISDWNTSLVPTILAPAASYSASLNLAPTPTQMVNKRSCDSKMKG